MKPRNDLQKGLKVGIIDIESTGLRADFGYMVCVCFKDVNEKDLNGKTHTLRIDDKRNSNQKSDKWLVKETIKKMNEYDLLLGWYSSQFDFKFINSRAIIHRLKPPVKQYRRDLLYVARSNFKMRSNRLAVWSGIASGTNQKTTLTPEHHVGSIRGEKRSIDYIVKHCKIDVAETEKVYKRFMPYLGQKLRKGG